MIYLKSLLVGISAFLLSVGIVSVLTVVLMWRNSSNWTNLGWGSFMDVGVPRDIPGWPGLAIGVLAFIVSFWWTLRKASITNLD